MRALLFTIISAIFSFGLNSEAQITDIPNKQLDSLFNSYDDESMELSPVYATYYGDNRYNDLLPAEFTDSYRTKYRDFYTRYIKALSAFKRETLSGPFSIPILAGLP